MELALVVVAMVAVVVAVVVGKLAEWAWFRPLQLERVLRAQGLVGTRYRSLKGDMGEYMRMLKEATSKPMELSHNIGPRVAPFYHKLDTIYGKQWICWIGPNPRVQITDPAFVKEIMTSKFSDVEKPKLNPQVLLLISGLGIHEGEKWAKHRKILNPAFHLEKLKQMAPVFQICCDEVMNKWENSIGPGGSCELEVHAEFMNLTGDVISKAAFGSSFEEGRLITSLQSEQAYLLLQQQKYAYIPGFRFLPTTTNKKLESNYREMNSIMRRIIEKKERALKLGEGTKNDLLGLLLASNLTHQQEDGNKNAKGMTIEDVIDECKLFYFAGFETTALLLTWTMITLSMHPDWQIRAREEVLALFGHKQPDWNGLSRLKIVTMIFNEVLRLYPPVSEIVRKTYKDEEIGGIKFPARVMISLPTLVIHRDPELWGEDALEFKPERFAEGVTKATNNKVCFIPFGWGPRICIGQNFALLEAKMCLSQILQKFEFELAPSYVHAPLNVMTLHPQHGAQIRLRKI